MPTLSTCPNAPGGGRAEVAIDLVALTANNITYAALGQKTPFWARTPVWDFFPARQPGRLPVWGFATVTRSAAEGSRWAIVLRYWRSPARDLAADRFAAPALPVTPRRAALPAACQYSRLKAWRSPRADHDWWPVYRPLFLTGWLIADQFEDEDDFDAETVIVSGASSKTALAFAHVMKARGGHRAWSRLPHRAAPPLPPAPVCTIRSSTMARSIHHAKGKVALVDFAGNPAATRAVHERFGDALAVDMIVGITQWDAERGSIQLPGPRPIGFFAPGRMKKRSKDWGAHGLRRQSEEAWLDFMPTAKRLTEIDRRSGAEAALAAYRDAVAGKVDPRMGVLIEP